MEQEDEAGIGQIIIKKHLGRPWSIESFSLSIKVDKEERFSENVFVVSIWCLKRDFISLLTNPCHHVAVPCVYKNKE